jgi:hypothetical protein
MKERKAGTKAADCAKNWQTTQYTNLIHYVPSGSYFARLRVAGKHICKRLKTDVLTVAKLRLADLDRSEREAVVHCSRHERVLGHAS